MNPVWDDPMGISLKIQNHKLAEAPHAERGQRLGISHVHGSRRDHGLESQCRREPEQAFESQGAHVKMLRETLVIRLCGSPELSDGLAVPLESQREEV